MSRAMKWCGWTTSSFVKFLAECCCIWAKCKCGHCRNVESGNVQTEAFNRGLHPDEQSVFLEQSDLTTFGEEIPNIIHEASEGQAIRQLSVVENPRKSWLWDFDFMKLNQWCLDISDDKVWTDDDYFSCIWGGARVKKLRLRTSMLSDKLALHAGGIAGVQHHNQHVQEWDPWKASLGEWVTPGQEEKEHPARFVWQIVVAISCGTGKRLQFRLGVLHIPALQPLAGDSRSWWITLPPNRVSVLMMVPTGLHLPRCHPASSFATYYHMASSSMVESLDSGEALVDEREAMATYKRLAEHAGSSEKIATLLVSNMGYRAREDLET